MVTLVFVAALDIMSSPVGCCIWRC